MSGDPKAAKNKLTVPVDSGDHTQGPLDAPVTLVEYGDYQCPHCRQVYYNINDLQEQLGDRMLYVYRHLPISSAHPDAQLAAEAAEAAGAQGKFWEMNEIEGCLGKGRLSDNFEEEFKRFQRWLNS